MFGLFKNKKRTDDSLSAPTVLKAISSQKQVVRMELDRPMVRFKTRLLYRDKVVLVAKPPELTVEIAKGDVARFKIPWEKNHEVRMEVSLPQVNLSNGLGAFLCQTPSGAAFSVRRVEERFNTRRYKNLHVDIPDLGDNFRIVDLSATGCKIAIKTTSRWKSFKIGRSIGKSMIKVGDRMEIELDLMIPRAHANESVGMEFSVNGDGRNRQWLTVLLGTLGTMEVDAILPQPF